MQKDSIEYVKQLIREEGGYVSCVDPMGPVTVLFTKCKNPLYEETFYRYEKYAVEMSTWKGVSFDDFREYIRLVTSSVSKPVIFSVYTFQRCEDKIIVRLAFCDNYYGEQGEVSVEEAREIIKNPPENISMEYIQDIKALYNL